MVHIDENFVARPTRGDLDFKELFQEAIAARAGLTTESSEKTSSGWTPSTLADAIIEADPQGRGVDVRTVQNWFQDNDRGISSENIDCLARVFGMGDPDAIALWRRELSAANKRLASKRRVRRERDVSSAARETHSDTNSTSFKNGRSRGQRDWFAALSERVFTSAEGFGIAIIVWAGYFLLCLISFVFENHDITYAARPDLNKQVGLFWSLSWPIECLLLYPASFLVIAHLVSFWKREGWAMTQSEDHWPDWPELVDSLRLPFWIVGFVAFGLVFAVQWGGVYLLGLTQKHPPDLIDWIHVAHVRPGVVSFWEALSVSLYAFFYSGLIYWFYFVGLLLLFAVCNDYHRRASTPDSMIDHEFLELAGEKLQRGIFHCTLIGILAATAIQLNAIYLKSDGATSLGWLAADFVAGLGWQPTEWKFLDQSSVSSLTSSILLLLHVALFGVCTAKVRSALRTSQTPRLSTRLSVGEERKLLWRLCHDTLLRQLCTIGILSLNFALLGQFVGFTLLLSASIIIAVGASFWSSNSPVLYHSVEA